MGTSDTVAELAISLVDEGKDATSAVVDLREASLGRRVSLVMAKQKLAGDDRDTTAAVALLDEALNTGDWADAD
jgi:hypothetical protein